MIFGEQRDQFRRVFVDAWRKARRGAPLEPLEQAIVSVIGAHPEYHGILAQADVLTRDFAEQGDEANPFLHMAMHITIIEQITTDRPSGMRALYDSLRTHFHDSHALEHAIMQCLAQSLQAAREHGQVADEQGYIACVRELQRRVL